MEEILSESIIRTSINGILDYIDQIISQTMRRVFRGAMVVFSWFVVPYSRLRIFRIPNKKLPPIKDSLLEIRAVTLAHMIRTGQITSEAVVKAYINRCKEVNPLINAIVEDRFEQALEDARAVDLLIKSGIKSIDEMAKDTPILGVPVTVKESIAVKGMINQSGRVFKVKDIAPEDAPAVHQLKKHGGIVLLVSNTPELCMCWETYNNVTGLTKNPYNLKRTAGGSSGGEAALLGSGASLIGLSSDIAGSARLPAMFNGVYGHKPSPYVVSPYGHKPQSNAKNWGDFFTIAPMCRYASDLPLLLKCIMDPNGPKLQLNQSIHIDDIQFYFMNNDGPSGTIRKLDNDIKQAMDDVSEFFHAKKVQLNKLKWALEISMSAMLRIEGVETIYEKPIENQPKKTIGSETLKYVFGRSDSIFPSVLVGHLQEIMKMLPESRHRKLESIAAGLKKDFQELLGNNGVFIYPTFPNTAHKHFEIYCKLVDTGYMMIFNAIGMPVTNCMIRMDRKNLPIGIQIVANPGCDHLSLAVARAIETKFGGWIPPS